jgi:hypothetical protein
LTRGFTHDCNIARDTKAINNQKLMLGKIGSKIGELYYCVKRNKVANYRCIKSAR